ncbi:MAG: hypothetical protein ACK4JA_05875 [Parazoarcus communis]
MNRRQRLRSIPTIADMAKAFGCIDAMLYRLADGWIHEIQGNAVFRNPQDGVWYDIPAAMEGWIALWERIDARYRLDLDLDPARKIVGRLRYGSPIPPELVKQCQTLIYQCKRAFRRLDVYEIGSLVKTQLIANEVELAGLSKSDQPSHHNHK